MDMAPVDVLPGERVLWEGRPTRLRLFWPTDMYLIPFSLLWGGIAIFLEVWALVSGGPDSSSLWGIPFVVLGFYVIAGRFVVRAISLRRTHYVITDRRVIVTGGVTGRSTESSYLHSLPPPMISERGDRSGTLSFGAMPGFAEMFNRNSRRSLLRSSSDVPAAGPVLVEIAEVRSVRDIVANAQKPSA